MQDELNVGLGSLVDLDLATEMHMATKHQHPEKIEEEIRTHTKAHESEAKHEGKDKPEEMKAYEK